MLAPALVWSAIGAFLLFGLVLVWNAARANRGTAADYYLAGSGLGGLVSGLSYAATTYSAFMLVVLTGLTWQGGIGALGFELIYFAGLSLLVVFGPRFWLAGKRWGFISPAEMIGARYGSRAVAAAMAAVSLLFLIPYCTTQMAGIGLLLSGATGGGISLAAAVVTGAALALVWTLFAGLRSVAWTDAGQAVVMMVSGLLAVALVVAALGSPSAMVAALSTEDAAWLDVPGPGLWSLGTFLALSVPWFFFAITNPQVSQRLFMLRDLGAMRRMILWVLGVGFVFTLIAVIWGFAARLLAPDLAVPGEATPALLASGVLPAWVSVLLILGILSAAVSTLDSIALTVGSMVARDLLPEGTRDAAQILWGRVVVILVIAFAAVFALRGARIVEQLAALSAAGLAVTVPPVVGAFFWRCGTAAGALACLLGGAALAMFMVMVRGVSVYDPALAFSVIGASVLLFVVVSLATRPRATALDFAGELRAELDAHRVW
ncbi:MAG: sodium:solute symporter family protein [Rubellimicrobium sp.]|nr:sodium:solute symporter family protein [Rubellimicrobium sp.]